MTFAWDPYAAERAGERFTELAGNSEYLNTMVYEHVESWNGGGLLDLLVIHHQKLARELGLSAGCTPAMLTRLTTNLDDVAALYQASDNDAAVRIDRAWDTMGYDVPASGDADLERHGGEGYDFGTDLPSQRTPQPGDFTIQDFVNTILGLPGSLAVPGGAPDHPVLREIWRAIVQDSRKEIEAIATLLSGDWDGVYRAGDAMCGAGDHWRELGDATRHAAGTLYRHWNGDASEFAERFTSMICDLYTEAGADITDCGLQYKAHAHGCYLLFGEITSILGEIPDLMHALFMLIDAADRSTLPTAVPLPTVLGAIYRTITQIFDKLGDTIDLVRKVLYLVEAVVAIVLAAVPLFADYSNKMRGALD
ncbi:hypothetical protein [Amycolatopsis sp. 195334CR]|uniref:hypothetical protein n=1 Tax=Amycolatopsis sp. 195334CR TaxID=2814588 RepID=UPI001A8E1C4A|nr:hypothetical protein [Amycolatopsis sp. 195334CR]MBN6041204.1 hypothetical protein [Amycolatopsis sp. 195334CR]